MSELTPCNYCNLKWEQRHAAKTGKVVVVRPAAERDKTFPKAMEVLVHKPGEEPDSKKHFRMWFAELSDHCVC